MLDHWHLVSCYLITVIGFLKLPWKFHLQNQRQKVIFAKLTSGCSTGEKKANSSMNYVEPTCRWQLSKPQMHEYRLKLLMNDLTYQVRQLSYLNRSSNVYTQKLLLYLDDHFGLFLHPIALNLSTECLLSTCGINMFIH